MRQHDKSSLIIIGALLMLMNTPAVSGQSSGGSFTITSHVAAGGGCGADGAGGCTPSIGSGNLVVSGTVAEPGASDLSHQSPYSARGGFWYATLGNNSPTAANGTVSGRILDQTGLPVEGAVVRLSGTQDRKTITDANGNYNFLAVQTNGFYTVTPSRVNYNFNPFNRSFSQLASQTEAVFTAESMGENLNPLDTPEYFVRQQYVDVMGREAEENGFNYWSERILGCGEDALCVNSRRKDVAAAFFMAEENQASGVYIYDVYAGALGRRPGFGEFSTDRRQVVGGATLDAAKRVFAQNFVQRAEFRARYQNAITAESFVDALLQSVHASGVDLSGERSNLIGSYNQGADLLTSRAAVVRSLADNATFKQSQYNQAFVLTEYFAYLRRDSDQGGYDFWVNVLNSGGQGNYRGMVCSFITATEYQQRFSAVVSHTNGECGK